MSDTLNVGDIAPDFTAETYGGEIVKLSDYHADNLVALYFYPKDNTPGCTKEACSLRDGNSDLADLGVQVVGVSTDGVKAHENFKNKYDFPYPLLADEDKSVIEAYGVWGQKKFMGKEYDGIHRTTFVIDENGILEDVITKVKTKAHAEQILEK